jgi:hypothetical protein
LLADIITLHAYVTHLYHSRLQKENGFGLGPLGRPPPIINNKPLGFLTFFCFKKKFIFLLLYQQYASWNLCLCVQIVILLCYFMYLSFFSTCFLFYSLDCRQ